MNIKSVYQIILTGVFLLSAMTSTLAQQSVTDSLKNAGEPMNAVRPLSRVDSLDLVISSLTADRGRLVMQTDSLRNVSVALSAELGRSGQKNDSLARNQEALNRQMLVLRQEQLTLNNALAEQAQKTRDKEFELMTAESRLREFQNTATLNQVKLESQIGVNSTKLEAKDREISYLEKSVDEKNKLLDTKNQELVTFYIYKDNTIRIIDSLNKELNRNQLELVRIEERQRLVEQQLNEFKEKQAAAQNKKKKIRFVQGVALRGFRPPDWQLAPKSSSSSLVYVISNKNAGNVDFDYMTGVSLSLYDLSKENSKFTYDAGLFVGFGGQNLFKNFYIGPSFKVFDFIHLNLGANIVEFNQLKPGFEEGDELANGLGIPTQKGWKVSGYFGFNVDIELLMNIPKKF